MRLTALVRGAERDAAPLRVKRVPAPTGMSSWQGDRIKGKVCRRRTYGSSAPPAAITGWSKHAILQPKLASNCRENSPHFESKSSDLRTGRAARAAASHAGEARDGRRPRLPLHAEVHATPGAVRAQAVAAASAIAQHLPAGRALPAWACAARVGEGRERCERRPRLELSADAQQHEAALTCGKNSVWRGRRSGFCAAENKLRLCLPESCMKSPVHEEFSGHAEPTCS